MSEFSSPASQLLELEGIEDIDPSRNESTLPSYTRRPSAGCSTVLMNRRTKKFTYKLAKSLTQPGISLSISGDSKLSKDLPSFMEGDQVAGAVQISVHSGQDIRSISVSLRGRVLTGRSSDGVFTFLNLHDTLWSGELGDLQAHKDPTGEYDYSWPFSLALPKDVVVSPGNDGRSRTFPLPHTFVESGIPARVLYQLVVSVKQSKWKRNRRVSTQIGYFQSNQSFRDLATSADEPSDGTWKTLKTVTVTGSVAQFQHRPASLDCTLSLKGSSSYTRGSAIPLRLEIQSQDRLALELLSSPDAVNVHLNRRIRYKDVQMFGGSSSRWSTVIESVGAVTWVPQAGEGNLSETTPSPDYYRSALTGKLKLKRSLVPSASIANLSIEYFISLYPFSSPAFLSKDNKSTPLISRNVQINTDLSVYPDDLASLYNFD
ncbi:hypothetical protein D9757_002501 [Collybiopsis confluens]|uniref:Arrestin-like N-terminal domain-containing protein n=1 Tax=Collybiopsis confluens TaxID=2823264 RepID=A0A8H5HY14_9AGAR|nr:hypothetical protein D9757_002501 [Collybiopsis confluens]